MEESSSREEILANFQACSGIDDVGEAFMHLEETNWNLVEALQRVLPESTQSFRHPIPDNNIELIDDEDIQVLNEVLNENVPPPVPPRLFSMGISPGMGWSDMGSSQRVLNIEVMHSTGTHHLKLRDTETIGKIKMLLHEKTGVPTCQIELSGWNGRRPPNDDVTLQSLNLPRDITLYMSTPPYMQHAVPRHDEIAERLLREYRLIIHDDTNMKIHPLRFPGIKTVLEVKQDTHHLTDIPVRFQDWKGWPPEATDDTTLAASGVDFPEHILHVSSNYPTMNKNGEGSSRVKPAAVDVIDSDDDEFEDANEFGGDDDVVEMKTRTSRQPLMSEEVTDNSIAAIQFSENFTSRYGDTHPMFFQGSLDDAIRESLMVPAKNRKPLVIYLHHDHSVLTNVFCSQVLCAEAVVSYISSNFNIWGWDLTFESNKHRLLDMITQYFDSVTASTVRTVNLDRLPLMLVVTRSRGSFEILSVIHGSMTLDEMMITLMQVHDQFNWQQTAEIEEERVREERESIKREQEEAYNASLLADRAKEEARKSELAQKQKIDEDERRKIQMEETKKQQIELDKQRRREEISSTLPLEPESGPNAAIIRFRLPGGEQLTRRFSSEGSLQVVFDFLFVKGFSTSDFKVLQTFPRKDLTVLDSSKSLKEHGLHPQETLIVEER